MQRPFVPLSLMVLRVLDAEDIFKSLEIDLTAAIKDYLVPVFLGEPTTPKQLHRVAFCRDLRFGVFFLELQTKFP